MVALSVVGTQYLLVEFTHTWMNEKHELKTTLLVYKSFSG